MIVVEFMYYGRVLAPEPNIHVLKHIPTPEVVVPVLHKGFLQNKFPLLYRA